jgi:DNA-directed RNA polymerase subunit M/transcription elongation factor TFIIS
MERIIINEYVNGLCHICGKTLRAYKIKETQGYLDEVIIINSCSKCLSLYKRKMKIIQRLTNVEWDIYIRNHS